jgi:hypothetical protein
MEAAGIEGARLLASRVRPASAAGLACLYNEKVDLYLDGELQDRARTKFS